MAKITFDELFNPPLPLSGDFVRRMSDDLQALAADQNIPANLALLAASAAGLATLADIMDKRKEVLAKEARSSRCWQPHSGRHVG